MGTIFECENASKAYGGLMAVKDLTFSVNEGDIFAIAGPNGAGKTTLFDTITGVSALTGGAIRFEGREIQRLHPDRICRLGIARTFQTTTGFDTQTVLTNALVGATLGRRGTGRPSIRFSDDAVEAALDALEFCGMLHLQSQQSGRLPVFDRKRLMVATALATQPKLLLLDEPVGGLNRAEREAMIDLICKVQQSGVTVLLIEHIMKAVLALANRLLILHHGQKVAEGLPAEVLRDERVIEVYLGGRPGSSSLRQAEEQTMLKVTDLHAGYAGSEVLHSVSLHVGDAESVVVLGPNGHGKTTLLRAISGLIRATGTIELNGQVISNKNAAEIVKAGVVHIPQGDLPFPELSVMDNLLMGAYRSDAWRERKQKLEQVFELFPTLKERPRQLARSLSGGERRMLALGRGLMGKAKLFMIDEPSLGLAPFLIENVYAAIGNIRKTGLSILLLVDENADHIAGLADRVYLLEGGILIKEGRAEDMLRDAALLAAYLG